MRRLRRALDREALIPASAPVAYTFNEGIPVGPKRPRQVVCYAAGGRPAFINLPLNRLGQPELTMEARDVRTIRFDLSEMLEKGEGILEASIAPHGCCAGLNYSGGGALLTVWGVVCHAWVAVEFRMTTRETLTERLFFRLPQREGQCDRIGQPPFSRGAM